jgi:hypothetical protein
MEKENTMLLTIPALPGMFKADDTQPGLLSHTGPIWHVFLSHDQIQTLNGPGGQLAVGLLPPPYDAAVEAVIGYVALIDEIGGNRGVDITGVIGIQGVIVTPQALGAYGWLVKGASVAIAAGETIANFVMKVASVVPDVAKGVCSTPGIITLLATGGNLPIAAVVGLVSGIFGKHDTDTTPGAVKANQSSIGGQEAFVLIGVGKGNDQITLLSWQGFFSAQQGGGAQVYANRAVASIWETWTLLRNSDGTVSFRTFDNQHYLGTSSIPDHSCWADQTQNSPGGWCRFTMQDLGSGHVALKTVYGTYVTVFKNASSRS